MTIDRDLIIPRQIPFADTTESEAEGTSAIFDIPYDEVRENILSDDNNAKTNPIEAVRKYLIPMGKIFVDISILDDVAYKAALAVNIAKLNVALDKLKEAVVREDSVKISKKTGKPLGSAYLDNIAKLKNWLIDPVNRTPPYSIWVKGNKKLPFWAFSTLPAATCPFAGECLVHPTKKEKDGTPKRGWCYSFRSWRNFTPFCRQLQNTILIRIKDKSWIEKDARTKFEKGQVVRLYVDGDMDSVETIAYWFHFCARFPTNRFYGYSKSWDYFKKWGEQNNFEYPENYLLNLSSGTIMESTLKPLEFQNLVRSMFDLKHPKTGLNLVRGTFRAISGIKSKYPEHTEEELNNGSRIETGTLGAWNAHKDEVKAKAMFLRINGDYGDRGAFVCTGYCGQCLANGEHACGSRKMQGVSVVIGIH
mgnify:CR=1 FL=1|jgi:hypothetical protein